MSVEAAVIQYKKDFVPAFEQKSSMLRHTATKEVMMSGNQATFLVNGNASDTATTRGTNGLIPYNNPTNTQYTATLVEKHAPYRLTGFNVFASQGDQVAGMRKQSIATINRDIDLTLLAELANATQDYGTGTASIGTVQGVKAILGNNDIATEEADNMFGVVSPSFMAYLEQTTEFASGDYVDFKPYSGPVRRVLRWSGINWITSSRVTGLGTSSELCYIYHKDAVGYACNVGEEKVFAGFNEEQGFSWSRAEVYHGAKILQNTGIVKITHDGSAFAAT